LKNRRSPREKLRLSSWILLLSVAILASFDCLKK
jgi:hypothetical protein